LSFRGAAGRTIVTYCDFPRSERQTRCNPDSVISSYVKSRVRCFVLNPKLDFNIVTSQYVAAFAVSALASQLNRLGKPFNPLLGETYEYQR